MKLQNYSLFPDHREIIPMSLSVTNEHANAICANLAENPYLNDEITTIKLTTVGMTFVHATSQRIRQIYLDIKYLYSCLFLTLIS